MKVKASWILLLVAVVLALGFSTVSAQSCDDALGCVVLGADDPVVIGYMLTISGGTAFLGEDSQGGIEVAIDDRGGMALDREIELIGEDSLCNAEGGQAAGQRLAANEELLGIIGSSCSSEAAAALPIISEAGLLMISPSNTAPRLTNSDADTGGIWQPGYYRTAHNDLFQGRIAAEFIYNILGKTKLATVHDGSPYADGLQGVAADVFAEIGGEVVFQGAINVGDTDMSAILTEIQSAGPEVVYFPIFEPESNFFTAQAREILGPDVILIGADASLSDSFPENTGEAAIGKFMTGPFVQGESYDAFLERWDEVIGGVPPSGFHAHAYDATNILLDAVEAVAVDNGDGTVTIGRQALRDQISSLTEFEGLTGVLTCNETGDCATGEALAVYELTQAELDGNWPPPVVWLPGMEEMMAPGS